MRRSGNLGDGSLSQLGSDLGRSSTAGFGSTDGFGDQYIFSLTGNDRCILLKKLFG
jgi:hypothetical protein